MKILIFIFLFFVSFPVLALDPVIIQDTIHDYPTTSGNDQDYIPSDPTQIDTVILNRSTTISQTFHPIVEDGSTTPIVYQYQTIDRVGDTLNSDDINTMFYRQNYEYFARPLFDPLAPVDDIKGAFTSYSALQRASAFRRSLPATVQKCLISNQVSDIATFIDGGNSVCIDREIDTSQGKIRVGEIISALIKHGDLIYYPDTSCPSIQIPTVFPPAILSSLLSRYPANYNYRLTYQQYYQLYLYGIETLCTNSLAQVVEHCDQDSSGRQFNCRQEIRSQPLAAATAQGSLYSNLMPASAAISNSDYSQSELSPAISDKPNPIGWLAQFFRDFFSGRLSENRTFSGDHTITTKVDSRQVDGLDKNKTMMYFFFPQDTIDTKNLKDLPSSATNGVTTDPGEANSSLTESLYQELTPASWH